MGAEINKEIIELVTMVSNAKQVDVGVVWEAVEAALAAVAAKSYPEEVDITVTLNRETGISEEVVRTWTVLPDDEIIEFPGKEMHLAAAKALDPELDVGDIVAQPIEAPTFGRIGAQQARQILFQKVKAAERAKIVEEYEERVGELLTGTVRKVGREGVIIELGTGAEALIPREEMMPREILRMRDRVRTYLYGVRPEGRGPQLLVSRTHPNMLVKLFELEVPEVGEQVIKIMAAARDPGVRAKIAVKTNDGRIDPIGACVGMRGSRVQAVSNELNGERVDIILWDDNPAQLVINAMAPAEVSSIMVDEEKHSMDIIVDEEQLSQAIGRGGQNVRLATELTGWTLNVMSESDSTTQQADDEGEQRAIQADFAAQLEVDEDIAEVLVQEGFASIEDIAYAPLEELANIEVFDEEMVEELQRRAKEALLRAELALEEKLGEIEPEEDLLALESMTRKLALQLASEGMTTREQLAECAIDDLVDIKVADRELAGKLIMQARQHWFEEENNTE